jgi:HTH-type transcriptional regulator / antitoxin HipB
LDYPVKTLSQLRPILQGFRKAAGLTQAMVAAQLGVTQQTYAQLEANPAAVSMERLFKVFRVLGVDIALVQAEAQPVARPAGVAAAKATARRPASKKQRENW